MATKKTTGKTSSRAKINIPASVGAHQRKTNVKKTAKTAEKYVKNLGIKGVFISFICLILGIAIGLGAYFAVSKNDVFEIVGEDEITLSVDEKYVERGVKIIEFGKDISDKAIIDSNLDLDENGYPSELGTFYIKYTVDSLKYGKIFKIQKVRLISVVEQSEGGE